MYFYISLIMFSLVCAITPGPNNISLMMSASTNGLRDTIPHYLGVVLGYPIMLFIIGCGLSGLFIKYPIIYIVVKNLGACYIMYMAWKIINATIITDGGTKGKSITFTQSLFFQWINPKGLITAISAVSAYTNIHSHTTMPQQIIIIAFIAVIVTSFGAGTWMFGGVIVRQLLKHNVHLKIFNYVMGGLLVLSVLMIILE